MNKIQQFAADLKSRKNPKAKTARNDTPAPAPPVPRNGVPADGSRLVRLKAELRKANERANQAEAALAPVAKVQKANGEIWRLQQEITRLQAAAKRRLGPQRAIAVSYAAKIRKLWKRIDALEAENEQLRNNHERQPDEHGNLA